MRSINKVILIGRVGRDPEIKSGSDNRKFAVFSLATSQSWRNKMNNSLQESVEWHNVMVFSEKMLDFVEKFVQKGALLYLEGKIHYYEYEDDNGKKQRKAQINIDGFSGNLISLETKTWKNSDDDDNSNDNSDDSLSSSSLDSILSENSKFIDDEIPF